MTSTANLEVAIVETTDGLTLVSVLAEKDEEVRFRVPADALELTGPQPCFMTHTPPFDFAQCEKHDTTFALGDVCKWHNRDPWEVIYEETDAQRARAVLAERDRDHALDQLDIQYERAVMAERHRNTAEARADAADAERDIAVIERNMAIAERDTAREEVQRLRRELEILNEHLSMDEDPIVLLVDRFASTCGECGRPADADEKAHESNNGCGREFTHISSRYLITPQMEDRLREMRPDLTFKKHDPTI